MTEHLNLSVFLLCGEAIQCYMYFNVKIICVPGKSLGCPRSMPPMLPTFFNSDTTWFEVNPTFGSIEIELLILNRPIGPPTPTAFRVKLSQTLNDVLRGNQG